MRYILLPVAAILVLVASCNKAVPPMSKQEVHRRIDSTLRANAQQSAEAARVDLERRMKIEVKVKVDSMVSARRRALPQPPPPASEQ